MRFSTFSWEQRKLGDVVQITMGQSPDGSTYSDEPSDYILVQGKLTSHILERNSMVLLEQLKTVDKSRIDSYIGTLSDEEMKMIDKALRISLAIGRYKKRSV